jgi:hypothetical protein
VVKFHDCVVRPEFLPDIVTGDSRAVALDQHEQEAKWLFRKNGSIFAVGFPSGNELPQLSRLTIELKGPEANARLQHFLH